jgi:hypothetical protein
MAFVSVALVTADAVSSQRTWLGLREHVRYNLPVSPRLKDDLPVSGVSEGAWFCVVYNQSI